LPCPAPSRNSSRFISKTSVLHSFESQAFYLGHL
jgi:hypothetical protein